MCVSMETEKIGALIVEVKVYVSIRNEWETAKSVALNRFVSMTGKNLGVSNAMVAEYVSITNEEVYA